MTKQLTPKAPRLTPAWVVGSHIFIIAVFGGATVHAQVAPVVAPVPVAFSAAGPAAAPASVDVEGAQPDAVRLLVGRSTLIDVGHPIARVSLTSADIADALVTSPSQLLVHGKGPGAISMFVWSRGGAVRRFEVSVQRDLTKLSDQVKQLFPTETIDVRSNGRNVVLSGSVSSKEVVDRAINVALGYVEKRDDVVTLLQVRPGPASNQVLLKVRFAEVSRSALTEFGMSFFTSPTGVQNTVGRLTTQQFDAPNFQDLAWGKAGNSDGNVGTGFGTHVKSASGKLNMGDILNLFLLSEKYDLGTVIRAMQARGVFQSLAEPNLVAESGKEASFLAGGEFPIPVVQGSQNGSAVSIQFKEFGVRLNFTPTVNGDRVHLKVKPEVSTLDYANGVSMQGFRIPALSTRRTETELELRNGQTFAIAGLMNNQMTTSLQKVPGIGDIPILGQLFKSRQANKAQTELVVMITPVILPGDSDGVTSNLPRLVEPYMAPLPETKTKPNPADAFTPDRRSGISVPVPSKADIEEQKLRERAAQEERDRKADEAKAAAEAAKNAPRDAAKAAEAQKRQQELDQKAMAKAAEVAAREQERLEKAAREQAKKDKEAAERAAKDAARQEKANKKAKPADDAAALPQPDPIALAEARARAAALAADAKPAATAAR
ncbi:MAG TPA: type II and III secretion system protein family protein [Vicinamibacterales bacterium]|jgi:pilus assembly protein CpaC|nr:type II and III secretion system protein family protein [Vicinamibacterales bacterium]